MSSMHQVLDIILAGVIAGLATFMISFVSISISLPMGMTLASGFYFSRHPWGSQRGTEINDKFDEFYENKLPF